jgi:hypothetical protein
LANRPFSLASLPALPHIAVAGPTDGQIAVASGRRLVRGLSPPRGKRRRPFGETAASRAQPTDLHIHNKGVMSPPSVFPNRKPDSLSPRGAARCHYNDGPSRQRFVCRAQNGQEGGREQDQPASV